MSSDIEWHRISDDIKKINKVVNMILEVSKHKEEHIDKLTEEVRSLKEHKNRQIDENRKVSIKLDNNEQSIQSLMDEQVDLNVHDKEINELYEKFSEFNKRVTQSLKYFEERINTISHQSHNVQAIHCEFRKELKDEYDDNITSLHKELANQNSRIEDLEHADTCNHRIEVVLDRLRALENICGKNCKTSLQSEDNENKRHVTHGCPNCRGSERILYCSDYEYYLACVLCQGAGIVYPLKVYTS